MRVGPIILLIAIVGILSLNRIVVAQSVVEEPIQKSACTSIIGYDKLDVLKADLLAQAERLAANELFGELIRTSTVAENLVVTQDQVQVYTLGMIRLQGDIVYIQGKNFAEVCLTIWAYTSAADRALFAPLKLSKRLCLTEPTLSVRETRERAEKEVIIGILVDYDGRLVNVPEADLPQLLHEVGYVESGFLPGSETYCVEIIGHVIPIEIMLFLETPITQTTDDPPVTLTLTTSPSADDMLPVGTPIAITMTTSISPTNTALPVFVPEDTASPANTQVACVLPSGEEVSPDILALVVGGSAAFWKAESACRWVYENSGVNASFRHPGGDIVITYWAGFPKPKNAASCEVTERPWNSAPTYEVRCTTGGAEFEADNVGLHAITISK